MIGKEKDSHKVYTKAPKVFSPVKAVGRISKDMGRVIKSSKMCVEWMLLIAGKEHKVKWEASKLSGKRRVYFDESKVAQVVKMPSQKALNMIFQLTTGIKFEIKEEGKVTELYINDESFSSLQREGILSLIRVY